VHAQLVLVRALDELRDAVPREVAENRAVKSSPPAWIERCGEIGRFEKPVFVLR
jgi:hypothetical protein